MTIKFPKSLGDCIDKLYELRAMRLAGQKEVDRVKAEETLWSDHILNSFTKSDLKGAKGSIATAGIKHQTVYNIEDWAQYIEWVAENGAYDCLQKRLSAQAIAARFDNGVEVPGVSAFDKITLSLTKTGA